MSENHNYSLDKNTANDMLSDILDSCNIPPSQDSLDDVMIKRQLEKKPLAILKYLAILFLLIAVVSPLFFKADPQFSIVKPAKNVVISSHSLYDDCFIMTLTGSADYNAIYSKKADGAIIYPDKIDPASGLVIFPYSGDMLNIYIPTINGECIQAVLNETNQ